MVSAMWSGRWDVRWFESLDSTNSYLLEQAAEGAPEGMVAVADHQRAGRGRLDRRWESPPGSSLLTSILFRPTFDPAELHLCTAAVALAAAEACRRVAGVGPVIKWPNDLLVGEAKLAGVLAEADFTGDACAVVVGIGINVAWPGPTTVQGTCLDDLCGDAGGSPPAPRSPAHGPGASRGVSSIVRTVGRSWPQNCASVAPRWASASGSSWPRRRSAGWPARSTMPAG